MNALYFCIIILGLSSIIQAIVIRYLIKDIKTIKRQLKLHQKWIDKLCGTIDYIFEEKNIKPMPPNL